MVSSDLGACEWFVWDLRRSGLIDRGQLDEVVGEFLKRSPRAEAPALAEFLVHQSILSPFQAERLLQGKTQGLVLGPYVLADAIGQGSMGQVYRATSKTDSQTYAVKVLPRRSMWNVRLARRQVRAFGQFTHPAVIPFIDVGTAGGQHYLVWPMAEGESLEARVTREMRLAPDVAAQIVLQIAQGLAQANQHGLFHGLIKPSNILIGSDGQARILDFGIGSLLAENEGESLVDTMSTANTLTSGLDCASPESVMDPTNRTTAGDQYSLGCILYYCLAGQYPFPDGTAVEKMMGHQFKQPTPVRELVPAVPEGLAAVVDRLMQKAPEARYPATEEIVEALQPFAAEARRGAEPVSIGRVAPRPAVGSEAAAGTPGLDGPRAGTDLDAAGRPAHPGPEQSAGGRSCGASGRPPRPAGREAGPTAVAEPGERQRTGRLSDADPDRPGRTSGHDAGPALASAAGPAGEQPVRLGRTAEARGLLRAVHGLHSRRPGHGRGVLPRQEFPVPELTAGRERDSRTGRSDSPGFRFAPGSAPAPPRRMPVDLPGPCQVDVTGPATTPEPSAVRRRRVVVLGSTGSIGTNTLDVIGRLPHLFEVVGLAASSRSTDIAAQAEKFRPKWVALTGTCEPPRLPPGTELLTDPEAVARRVQAPDVDVVVSAVVGAAGLLGTWAALEAGKTVALANKETLVVAGGLVMDLVRSRGGRLLPVDSEPSAIFQAIADRPAGVERVVLTGSGGPFRGKSRAELSAVTVEQALRHPTWQMGPKITVDSATLMNKALEVIEARWLFGLPADRIDVVIHPESMIHSFVEFVDGSVLAQISPPDMRLPIQYALTYPVRLPCPARRVNWKELTSFRFESPDRQTFPALDLGYEVAARGGTAGAVLNAANEVAVEAFLAREIPFLDIARAGRAVLDAHAFDPNPTLDGLLTADRWARQEVRRWIRPNP